MKPPLLLTLWRGLSQGLDHQTFLGWSLIVGLLEVETSPAFPPGVFVYLLAPDQAGTPLGRSAQFHELNKGGLYQCESSVEGGPQRETRYVLPMSRQRLVWCEPELSKSVSNITFHLFG